MWDFDNGWFNRFLPAVPMTDICKYLFIKDLGFLPTVEMTGQFVQKIEGKDGGEAAIFSPLPHVQIGSSFRPQGEISSASLSMCCENTSLLPQVELKIDVVKSHSKKKTKIAP